jgi:Fibronectin type III domain
LSTPRLRRSWRLYALIALCLAAIMGPASLAGAAARSPARLGPPTAVRATAQDQAAVLRWSAPRSDGGSPVTGYLITARPGDLSIRTTNVLSYQVGNLRNGVGYRFTVAAITAVATGPASAPTAVVRPAAQRPPGAPRAVRATPRNTSAVVSWKAPRAEGGSPVSSYTITTSTGATVTVSGDVRRTTVVGLTNGVPVSFRVRAANAVGTGPASGPSPAVRPAVGPPAAPRLVRTAPTGTGLTLSWTPPADDGGAAVSAYVVTSPGLPARTLASDATTTTIAPLRPGRPYTLTIRARNAKGLGDPVTTAPTAPDVTVSDATVVLTPAALRTLTAVEPDGTLTFQDAPSSVIDLAPGNVIVAGVSDSTPQGLLRTVVEVSTEGRTTTVRTSEAALDQALTVGAIGMEGSLAADQVQRFVPARSGVTLAGPRLGRAVSADLTFTIDVEPTKNVHVKGTEKITGTVDFGLSVGCCVHTKSHFLATAAAESKLELSSEVKAPITRSLRLGTVYLRPIVFEVASVPVVIVPLLDLTLEASGEVSVGVVTSASQTTTFGVDLTTKDAAVTARPIFSRSTAFTPPTVFGAADLKAGPRMRLSLLLYGVTGPYLQNTLWLLRLKADTSDDPWWKLQVHDSLGVGYKLKVLGHKIVDWEKDPIVDVAVTLKDAGGPFMGVVLGPDPATVPAGGTLALTATVQRSLDQTVIWSVERGGGSIGQNGLYTAPATVGRYRVTATSPANGLKPETRGTLDVEVTRGSRHGDGVLILGSYDDEQRQWLSGQLSAAGYRTTVVDGDALPEDIAGYGQIWHVSISPLSVEDQSRITDFIRAGGSAYLTGERPCCESLNAADTAVVRAVVEGGDSIQIGGLGDPFFDTGPLPVNGAAVGGVATRPFEPEIWTVSAPGGMAGVAPANVFAWAPGDPTVPVAAVWGPDQVSGGGRLAVFMDVNWLESTYRDPVGASRIAQNLALFLSGADRPPAPPVALAPSRTGGRTVVDDHGTAAH